MISILNYVLLGIIVYLLVIPIIEELATVIIQGLEVIKGCFVFLLTKVQCASNKLKKEQQSTSQQTRCIGFDVQSEEYYDDDCEEDDNDE